MPKLIITYFSLIIFIHTVNTHTMAQQFSFYFYCDNSSDGTSNTVYQTNLEGALSDLQTTDSGYGFFDISTGQYPDKAYAIALCRGDVNSADCDSCLNKSIGQLKSSCSGEKGAAGFSSDSYCMVKYSDGEILRKTSVRYDCQYWPKDSNMTDPEGFDGVVLNLMGNLTVKAAGGGSRRKYAADSMATLRSDYPTVYGTMQCTPDQSEQECSSCLREAVSYLSSCCSGKIAGRVLLSLCNLRYETDQFYGEALKISPSSSPAPPSSSSLAPPSTITPPSSTRHGKSVLPIVITVLAVTFMIILASVGICWMKKKKKYMQSKSFEPEAKDSNESGFKEYEFQTVKVATKNFSEENKIGRGGFGSVYKGELVDGQLIAVKKLSSDSRHNGSQFKNDVELVALLQHDNLARLLGFSVEGDERLLIYEFFSNASLDKFLLDPDKRALLDWDTSYKIIEGVARGLFYLHDESCQRIIHCDLKASNVLLDSNMDPKITDFGMTKLFTPDKIRSNTIEIAGIA